MQNVVKIKICGMREAENLHELAALKPDFFGFIFYARSPRFVAPEDAKKLPQFPAIRRVGVFVDETIETMLEIAARTNLFALQLHGDESPKVCAEIKRRNPRLKIIKAFSVDENFEGESLKNYETVCDYFLFDTRSEKYGGSGKKFDWQILRRFEIRRPFFLSGGIGAENVLAAVAACAGLPLFTLDLNSKIEIAPGVKSPQIARQIIESL